MSTRSKRGQPSWGSKLLIFIICIGVGLLIALQFKDINRASETNPADTSSINELRSLIANLQTANAQLVTENEQIKNDLKQLQLNEDDENAQLQRLREANERYQVFAGTVPVTGPGCEITLTNSRQADSGTSGMVSGSDLLTITNYLRAGGAQGIAINGQRLVAMSEIQTTGSYPNLNIVINGKIINNEDGIIQISVIGPAAELQSTNEMLMAYYTPMMQKGIGYHTTYPEQVDLPALAADSPAYRYALMEVDDGN